MANYYNVVGWKHTGITPHNRLAGRNVLNEDPWFKDPENYFQMKGIALNRSDMYNMTHIDLQGSVKDLEGSQTNAPNSTGSQPTGGPWYRLEEVDYLRITRTGYPGDPDYVDITGSFDTPWENSTVRVAYYFVTGLQPLARDVTRVFIMLDAWMTCGGVDELTIETGAKVRGHITEAEDASGYFTSAEPIGLLHPLETKGSMEIEPMEGNSETVTLAVSSTDLTQYVSIRDPIEGITAEVDGFREVYGLIESVSGPTQFDTHPGGSLVQAGIGVFDTGNARVKVNMSILFALGQLSIEDSYVLPRALAETRNETAGRYSLLVGKDKAYDNSLGVSSSYPRKAHYLYASMVLTSLTSGEMCVQNVYDLTDSRIHVWEDPTPNGCFYARFFGIKDHPFEVDQAVKSLPWQRGSIVMEGASGNFWNSVSHSFAIQSQTRSEAQYRLQRNVGVERLVTRGVNEVANLAGDTGKLATSGVSLFNWAQGGKKSIDAAVGIVQDVTAAADTVTDAVAFYFNDKYQQDALAQARNQINTAGLQSALVAPTALFTPTPGYGYTLQYLFGVHLVNVSDDDLNRLTAFFLRYGYSGLYKPMTDWHEVLPKSKVNYIECENVTLRHTIYPMRMTMQCSQMLQDGVFLWNCKPDQSVFAANPDA